MLQRTSAPTLSTEDLHARGETRAHATNGMNVREAFEREFGEPPAFSLG